MPGYSWKYSKNLTPTSPLNSDSRFVNSYHTKSRTAVMLSVAKNLLQGRNIHFTPGQMLHYVQHDTHVGFT